LTRDTARVATTRVSADSPVTFSCIDQQQHEQHQRKCSADRSVGAAASAVERSDVFTWRAGQ